MSNGTGPKRPTFVLGAVNVGLVLFSTALVFGTLRIRTAR
jgi:hypothetical protein